MMRAGLVAGVVLMALTAPAAAQINTVGWNDSVVVSVDGQRLSFMYNPWNFWDIATGVPGAVPVCMTFLDVTTGICDPAQPYKAAGHISSPDPWKDSNLYVATRLPSGGWSTPAQKLVGCCAHFIDPNTVYTQEGKPANPADRDIVRRVWTGASWAIQALGTGLNSGANEDNPHVVGIGNVIYFESSTRLGGYGGMDLYRASRTCVFRIFCGNWTVKNLGPSINTPQSENQVWVSPDDTWLVYNRNFSQFIQHTRTGPSQPWGPPSVLDVGLPQGTGAGELTIGVYNGTLEAYYVVIDPVRQAPTVSWSQWNGTRWVAKGPVD